MKRAQRIRRTAVAFAAILVGLAVMTTGCIGGKVAAQGAKVAVRAVARGVPTAAPFFEEALRLGTDALVGETLALGGGTRKGDQPGLYGGSRRSRSCDKNKLVRFLKDPAHRRKAVQWATAQGMGVDEIEGFVKKLTPVVLRNDTLVRNHDYKKGKAVGFDALLEAGIAVLVDAYGKPAVQCSCGNPLGTFEHDVDSADVTFQDKGKKWRAYDPEKVVKIEPVAEERPVTAYELVDIEDEDAGLERRAGTDGAQDKPLRDDPGAEKVPGTENAEARVPAVTDRPVQEATQILEDRGFRVQTNDGLSGGAAPGTVLDQDPAAEEQVPHGATVTLTVAPGPDPARTESPSPTSSPTDLTDKDATVMTALADETVRESPSSTSPGISSVAAGDRYPATCYGHGETTTAHGSTSALWVRLGLKSGGLGWVTATALQEDPAARGLGQC
ncbi:PASTA domain-containing protein [Streptomyces marianii]|nr:PASTA domain-containing protein [Streptomyces marianii]